MAYASTDAFSSFDGLSRRDAARVGARRGHDELQAGHARARRFAREDLEWRRRRAGCSIRRAALLPFVVLHSACGSAGSPNASPARVLYQVDGKLQALTYLVVQGDQVYVSIGDGPGVAGQPNELLAVPREIGPAKVLGRCRVDEWI